MTSRRSIFFRYMTSQSRPAATLEVFNAYRRFMQIIRYVSNCVLHLEFMSKWWWHRVSKGHNSTITTVRIYGQHFSLTRWHPPRTARCHNPQDHNVKTSLAFTYSYTRHKKVVIEHLEFKVGQFELENSGCKMSTSYQNRHRHIFFYGSRS